MDKILYTLVSVGGGEDGRDHTDKGGKIVKASFNADDFKNHDSRLRLEKTVIETEQAKRAALAKLSPVDKLVLGLETEKKPVTRRSETSRVVTGNNYRD